MDKILKVPILELDPVAPDVERRYKHWEQLFKNYLDEVQETVATDRQKSRVLQSMISETGWCVFSHCSRLCLIWFHFLLTLSCPLLGRG